MSAKCKEANPSVDKSHLPSFFLPAERKNRDELARDIHQVAGHPLIHSLMSIANGLFAVLNEQRQVIAVNKAFLELMGIEDAEVVLGLRLGEYIHCIHACEMPGGCGTSKYCPTCGAAVSMMAAMESRKPQERTCAITAEKDQKRVDLFFSIRSCPVTIGDGSYLLFFMQDITLQQNKNCLDSTFFHDINNIILGLVGKSELLSFQVRPLDDKVKELHQIVMRIAQEVAIQDSLRKSLDNMYKPLYSQDTANSVLCEIDQLFSDHPLTATRVLEVSYLADPISLTTDFCLVNRIVRNMVTNALEATPDGGIVRLSVLPTDSAVTFRVWNEGEIPAEIATRIFQRNFSTKSNMGRGLGTYSMKLFGEQVLGGTVAFESTEESGTTFTLTLPVKQVSAQGTAGMAPSDETRKA